MNITEKHIASKKRIGTLDGKPVIEVVTSGGLYMVVYQKSGTVETLGTGPHRAVARYIAKKREPNLEISELSKSDHVEESAILSVVPKYEKLTDDLNAIARRSR
jgi:Cft2 family RNA processing exonuclease